MNNLKFRAWDKKQKKMINYNADIFYQVGIMELNRMEDIILMQFTGLKDKNGKEIFEGDIVKYRHINNVPFRKAQIKNIDGTVTLVIDTTDGFIYHLTGNRNEFDLTKSEVIGNIYQDKHLLK